MLAISRRPAFEVGRFGIQRVGGFAYIGSAPTYYKYTNGGPGIPGEANSQAWAPPRNRNSRAGAGNKGLERYGVIGMIYLKKYNMTAIYFRGSDSAWLGTNTAALPGATLRRVRNHQNGMAPCLKATMTGARAWS